MTSPSPRSIVVQRALEAAGALNLTSLADGVEVLPGTIYGWKVGRRTPSLDKVLVLNRELSVRSRALEKAVKELSDHIQETFKMKMGGRPED